LLLFFPPSYFGLPPLLLFFPPEAADGGGIPGMMRCFGTYLAADELRVDGFAMGLGTFPMATVSLVMKLDADPELPGGRYTVGLTTAAAAEVLAVATV